MFDDKVAIITGAGRGIGRATAELLAAGGARVVVTDLDADLAREVAGALPGNALAVAGDLTDPAHAQQVVEVAIEQFGQLDILVNNAGFPDDGPLHTMTDERFDAMLEIHVAAPFRMLRAAAPYLREPAKAEREAGREVFRKVVNVSSVSGTMGNAGQTSYAAGKAGVVGLTRALAKEWGPLKVNVNAVAFGFIDTRLTAGRGEHSHVAADGREVELGVPEQVRGMVELFAPLGRVGTVQEAAGPIGFLCSPWSNYVTGQVLTVSGGLPFGMS